MYGLWFMVYGLWFMVYGLWFMDYGLWFMVYGLWCTVYGLGFMVEGSGFRVRAYVRSLRPCWWRIAVNVNVPCFRSLRLGSTLSVSLLTVFGFDVGVS